MQPVRIFVGYDSKETVAYHVFCHSVLARASVPVQFTPVRLAQLPMERPIASQSTEFTYSRFLTPWVCDYKGWAIFVDCDFLCLGDIADLWSMRDDRYDVMVCKHDYQPSAETKFLGKPQVAYPRKNWSSLMLFNNDRCRVLRPSTVNRESGMYLHQFKWCHDDDIGSLPLEWNWLVGEYPTLPARELCMLHYTIGGCWFKAYRDGPYNREWFSELHEMIRMEVSA